MTDENTTYMQNREISWLRFNDRVLSEANQDDVAPFEKLKFISIFVSNLDEFFMVRVGSLHDMTLLKKQIMDSRTGMSPKEQIDAILEMLPEMYRKKDRLYLSVMKELEKFNIKEYDFDILDEKHVKYVDTYYKEHIKPFISSKIVDKQHAFPFISNGILSIFLELEKDGKTSLGVIEIPENVKSFVLFPGESIDFILTEKIIYEYADEFFSDYKIRSKGIIKITRNFDLDANSEMADEFDDYKDKMKNILKKRRNQSAVRVESNHEISENILNTILKELDLEKNAYFYVESPLNMKYVFQLLDVIPSAKKEKILYPKFIPYYLNNKKKMSIMEKIKKKDLLLSYPYEDIQTFIDLLDEAADDENVTSIKITIYRLAKDSKIAKALCRAVENGKEVTVCIELKARFDEESNIDYSNILYQAGCNIIYGFEDYKVHSKLCLITYKNELGEIDYITQVGTGNYNESTAKLYADFCLITGNREIGLDALDFFNNMAIGNLNGKYEHLVQSPSSLKQKFMNLIDREIEKGSDGFLFFKMNSFTDKDIIEKLSEASNNNVPVIMIIRGICCILPGIKNKTENVEIRAIVGRFLEHARIYKFGKGENADIYIGSADFMTRNTEKRVEIACPVYDPDIKHLIESYIDFQMQDNIKGRKLNSKGEYEPVINALDPLDSQEFFIEIAKNKRLEDLTAECRNLSCKNIKSPDVNSCSIAESETEKYENSSQNKRRGLLSTIFGEREA